MPAFAHARNCIGGLKEQDMYGVGVEFSFNNNKRFTTWMGAVMTCITMTLFMTFFGIRTIHFVTQRSPKVSMTRMASDYEIVDLWKGDQIFAVQAVNPKVGRIEMTWTKWHEVENEAGELVAERGDNPITLADCVDFLPGGKFEGEYTGNKIKFIEQLNPVRADYSEYLCPQGVDELSVGGHYMSEKFDYVKIGLKGCDLGEDCLDDEALKKKGLNLYIMNQYANLIDSDSDDVIESATDFTFYK